MNKDFAKKKRAKLAKSSPHTHVRRLPSWLWMASGLAMGIGLAAVLYWQRHHNLPISHPDLTITAEDSTGKIQGKSLAKRSTNQNGEVRFDFYNLLPNMAQEDSKLTTSQSPNSSQAKLNSRSAETEKMVIPSTTSALKEPLAKVPASEPENSISYLIQAGSFRQIRQAEELKAKLTLAGYQTYVQTYRHDNREKWHRVYIGPFKTRELALASQEKLERTESVHSLIVKNRV